MSKGLMARAELLLSDDAGYLYSYSCWNLNQPENRDTARDTDDGEIWISRDALPEPEIHEKIRRMPSGRKKTVVKHIPRDVPVEELISDGRVKVRNAYGTWEIVGDTDMMALRILYRIFGEYQEQGKVPEHVSVAF